MQRNIEFLKQIKHIFKNTYFFGPHITPNINMSPSNLKQLSKIYLQEKAIYKFVEVDKLLKKYSNLNNINFISKIELINYDIENDFYINNKYTFSDKDHWSSYGENIFGKRLLKNNIILKILL